MIFFFFDIIFLSCKVLGCKWWTLLVCKRPVIKGLPCLIIFLKAPATPVTKTLYPQVDQALAVSNSDTAS